MSIAAKRFHADRAATILMLLWAVDAFNFSATAVAHPTADGSPHISTDVCSRHPELFKMRPLAAGEAMALIQPAVEIPTIRKFDRGYVVLGNCTRFIQTFSNGIILSNGARFGIKNLAFVPAPPAISHTGLHSRHFIPPRNILKISENTFSTGGALSYIQSYPFGSHARLVLWSNGKKSVLGTIRCTGEDQRGPCALDHLILSSRHRIREFDFLPAPHAEMRVGSLWLSISLGADQEDVATYTIEYGQIFSP